MEYKTLIVEKADGVAKVTLNRPEAMNAINDELLQDLEKAFNELEKDEEVRAVIITGKGRAFSAGADLKFIQGAMGQAGKMAEFRRYWHKVYNYIGNFPKPTIAAINGFALAGGLELVQVCDFAILSREARIGDQHANYGLVAGGGGTQRLPRLIPLRKAKELLITGDWLDPDEAERLGLVNKVVPADKLEEEAMALAKKIAQKSPMASKAIKFLVNRGIEMALPDALELEIATVLQHFTTEDVAEGLRAFIEKRTPEFKGR